MNLHNLQNSKQLPAKNQVKSNCAGDATFGFQICSIAACQVQRLKEKLAEQAVMFFSVLLAGEL